MWEFEVMMRDSGMSCVFCGIFKQKAGWLITMAYSVSYSSCRNCVEKESCGWCVYGGFCSGISDCPVIANSTGYLTVS